MQQMDERKYQVSFSYHIYMERDRQRGRERARVRGERIAQET
jgi:hypothetical protein